MDTGSGRRSLRWGGLLLLGLLLAWLPLEDVHVGAALTLAALFGLWLYGRLISERRPSALAHLGWAALAGAVVPVMALVLMVFKSGLHAHGFSDFSVAQMVAVLALIPQALGVGLLVGLSAQIAGRGDQGEEAN